jgi:hypothetical protein
VIEFLLVIHFFRSSASRDSLLLLVSAVRSVVLACFEICSSSGREIFLVA